jgi:hypothetical protein
MSPDLPDARENLLVEDPCQVALGDSLRLGGERRDKQCDRAGGQHADPIDLHGLGPSDERRGEETTCDTPEERSPGNH